MKKIIITGYNGFVGSHLVNTLSRKYDIIGISNTPATTQKIVQMRKDVRSITTKELPKNVYCIIHLAALTDVAYCQNNPSICYDVNVKGTQNMLEIARKLGSKFIFVSTSHVYGVPQKLPIKEDHPKNPTSIYAASKLAAEIICESYARSYEMSVNILRFFSLYGPNSPNHLVTSRIITQMKTKNVIKLGNLYPKRDFVYVTDAIATIDLVLKSQRFNVYNIGSGKSYSILDICNIIKKLSRKKVVIKSLKSLSRNVEVNNVVADSSKIRTLGWKPKISLDKGLFLTFKWLNNGKKI